MFPYAEYRGDQDDPLVVYAAGSVAGALRSELTQPAATTESFIKLLLLADEYLFRDIQDTTPPDQHCYRNTDALTRDAAGQSRVATIYLVIYYPQAKECKP